MRKHPAVFSPCSQMLSVVILVLVHSRATAGTFSMSRAFWLVLKSRES